jgi:hypothetical protein
MAANLSTLDGLVTFYASHHAIRAEKVLKKYAFVVMLVPGPREISPNCGVALQFEYDRLNQVQETLGQNKVQTEAFHHYRIELTEAQIRKFQSGR